MAAISTQVEIDSRLVLRNIGYGSGHRLPARISNLVDNYLENAHNLLAPAYSCVIRDISSVRGSHFEIEDSLAFESRIVGPLLEHCHKVAIFLVTIDNLLEETVDQLAEDRFVLQAMVLDAIGSVAVESVADFLQGRVEEIAHAEGLFISRRLSPGYCDWDIEQQEMIFQAMDGNCAGVRLTEEYLMLPQKSISGIIGIGSSQSMVEIYNPCRSCNKVDCLGRR